MLQELLPNPDMHDDWRSYARALVASLENIATQATSGAQVEDIASTTPPALPAGFTPLWLNSADSEIYLATGDYSPPTAPNLFNVDTANLAAAAVTLNEIADNAVSSAKIIDANIITAKIANAAILTALIGDLQVVTGKISDLAVNTAKIANLAVDSAKIANLAVGAAHIQDLAVGSAKIVDAAVTNIKIGNVIQSNDWSDVTKTGWRIKKDGLIEGRGLALYDSTGALILGSGGYFGTVDFYTQVLNRPIGSSVLQPFNYADATALAKSWTYFGGSAVDNLFNQADSNVVGGRYMRLGNNSGDDQQVIIGKDPVVFDPDLTYEVLAIVRRVAGTGKLWLGIQGFAADRVTPVAYDGTAAFGSGHWFAAANEEPPLGDWTVYKGYVQGVKPLGSAGAHPDIFNPGFMQSGVKYAAPIVWVNHPNATGIYDVAWVSLEPVDKPFSVGARNQIKQADLAVGGFSSIEAEPRAVNGYRYTINFGAVATMMPWRAFTPNTEYTLSFWAETVGGPGGQIIADLFPDDLPEMPPTTIGTTAQKYTWTFNSGSSSNLAAAVGRLFRVTGDAGGAIRLWDIQFEEGNVATDWTPAPADLGYGVNEGTNAYGFGTFAAVNQITTANIAALLAAASIAGTYIQNAAIGTAHIADASIVNAKIADATIASAKIASLVIDKITAGTLDAVIDMGTGLIRFSIGGNKLVLGKGFGTSNQFVMWFGPSMAESAMTEAAAVFYLKTNGNAYFGGSLLSGVLKNDGTSSDSSATAAITVGSFTSNGNLISIVVGYSWRFQYQCDQGTGGISGTTGSATILIEGSTNDGASWTTLATLNATETERTHDVEVGVPDYVAFEVSGSTTLSWTPGALGTIKLRARLTARTLPTFSGTPYGGAVPAQYISIQATEA